ncbi:putative ribonuclease H-like domain-containing protein [Tanacetum coccineum]
MGLESLEARIVVHEKNEAVYEEDIAFLKYDVQVKDISIKDLKNQLEEALKEKDDLKLKLENFEESSKNLTKLINSQISAKDKAGLGYDSQMNKSEVVHSVFNSRESDVDDSLVNDRFKTGEGFHAVPPPYTRIYMPLRTLTYPFAGKDIVEKPKTVRPSAPIIEDWDTNSDNDSVFRPKSDQTKPKFTKINFVKSDENVKSVNKENTHRQVEYPRKKKPELNNKGRVTGQKEIRPVWNNVQRVNHQNKLTHPHPKRNFVPTTVATKSGQVPVNAAMQSSPRAASISIARPVNTAAPKSKVNDALPTPYSYFKAYSPVRRTFNQISAAKTNNFNEKVNTVRVNNVTTAGPKAVVSVAVGNGENVVKSSACWIWRPTGNIIDHNSKDMQDNPQYTLQDQGIFDNGCSRHMTRNKPFLTDYQEIDGGFVAFGGSPKGGKITGKGKIRTGKLDFEDVYFVKELKFNIFSVSQICDKKNNVLFTKTECLVLSPDFKLLDESQVTIDESNLCHKRLGHINFKTMNKLVRGNLVRGLPLKLFENDHTSVACQKGKQHKASFHRAQRKDAVTDDAGKKINEEPANEAELDNLLVQQKQGYANSTNRVSTIIPSVSVAGESFTNVDDLPTDPLMPDLEDTTDLLNTGIFSGAYDDEDDGAEADLNNLETAMNVIPIPTTIIHKDHPKDQIIRDINLATQTRRMTKISEEHAMVYRNKKDKRGIVVRNKARLVAQGYTQEEGIDYDEVFAPVARIEAIRLFLAYASFMGFIVYQMDVKSAFLYGTIEEEVYVCQPPSFEDPQFPDKVYKVEKALYGLHQAPRAWYETLSTYLLENGFRRGIIDKTLFIKKDKGDILLVQVYVDDIIFGSTKKSLCTEFESLMHKKFQMSSMAKLTFFLGLRVMQRDDGIFISQDKYVADILKKFDFSSVKIASTLIETNKALHKDEEAEDVDVHLYRSMIGSLMYLTAFRPDIMFVVCACARDSPFDLEAFSDSDYARASLDRKSKTEGCQFHGKMLISWQCKKKIVVANSTTEAEYVAAANYCG